MYMTMKKTSLYIDDSLDRALAVRAAEQGITKAELIRITLGAVVVWSRGASSRRPSRWSGDGKPGIARDIDSYLDESGFGE